MYGIYANIWGILMVNVTIYSIHGSYGNHQIYIDFVEFYFETNPDWFALLCLYTVRRWLNLPDNLQIRI